MCKCEDCGEDLKKPKLPIHFNRCSAYKLSCLDCGVVFDQQSVLAYSSCVTEAEKCGPKGLNKSGSGPVSKSKNGQVANGPGVDFSRGLSRFPPWSCSLCNVKATSQEALELHGQGKKHQSRAKATAAKERSKTDGGGTSVSAGSDLAASKDDSNGAERGEGLAMTALDQAGSSARKKRKKERLDEGGDRTPAPSGNLEKKLKRGTSTEDERSPEQGKDPEKKRKLAEEDKAEASERVGHSLGKKSRKKGKLASEKVNGHDEIEIREARVPESSGTVGIYDGEQVQNIENGSYKDLRNPLGNCPLKGIQGVISRVDSTSEADFGVAREIGGRSVDNTDKITKKPKCLLHVDVSKRLDASGKMQQEDVCEGSKKEMKKKMKEQRDRESVVHEISSREWLGEDDGIRGETPTHPPHDIYGGTRNLELPESMEKSKQSGSSQKNSSQESIAKVVKWEKIIRNVLGKLSQSLNGKLKKKDLKRAVLPLAQKAMESASISVDRKALKAEFMRQVTGSPHFVVEGKHLTLASKV